MIALQCLGKQAVKLTAGIVAIGSRVSQQATLFEDICSRANGSRNLTSFLPLPPYAHMPLRGRPLPRRGSLFLPSNTISAREENIGIGQQGERKAHFWGQLCSKGAQWATAERPKRSKCELVKFCGMVDVNNQARIPSVCGLGRLGIERSW